MERVTIKIGLLLGLFGLNLSILGAKDELGRAEGVAVTLKELRNDTGDTFWIFSGSTAYPIEEWIDTKAESDAELYKQSQQKNLNQYTLQGGKELQLYQRVTFDGAGDNTIGFLLYNKRTKTQAIISFHLRTSAQAAELTIAIGAVDNEKPALVKTVTLPVTYADLKLSIALEHGTPEYSLVIEGSIKV